MAMEGDVAVDKDNDGIGLLLKHHGKVRQHLRTLRALEAVLSGLDADAAQEGRAQLREFIRFIDHCHPLHEQDETHSLFPRLEVALARQASVDAALLADFRAVKDEHEDFVRLWEPVREAMWVLSTPDAILSRDRWREAVATLCGHFEGHFAREEARLFPAAAALLSAEETAAVAAEIRQRHASVAP